MLMTMKIYTLLLLLLSPFAIFADHDSVNLYSESDLVFKNKFEESAYKALLNSDVPDFLTAAFAVGSDLDEAEYQKFTVQFNLTIQSIQLDKNFHKKPRKQIDFIFETIHDEYFKLYKANPLFSDIQKNGDFNCLTASVLYGIAFEKLGIPYEIKIIPNHAYVVAYPNSESQIVETTNPMRGTSVVYERKEKYKMVNELVDFKLVSQDEVDEKGVDAVFSENYLGEETLNLKECVGALYLNAAIEQMGNYKYVEAYELYKKSSLLYPKKTTNIMLLSTAATIVDMGDYETQSTLSTLADMEKFGFMGVPDDIIIGEFTEIAAENVDKSEFEKVDSGYEFLMNKLKSEAIKDEISFVYYYDKAVYLESQEQLKEAWLNLEKAAEIRPEDQDTKDYMSGLFYQLYKDTDSEILFGIVDSVEKNNCQIINESWFKSLQKGLYLDVLYNNYYYEHYEKAEEYRTAFEEKYPPAEIQDYKVKNYLINIYSMAAMRYFSMNKEARSKAVLQSGLKYAPESYELKSKMDALKY
jgi:hypothetical protein